MARLLRRAGGVVTDFLGGKGDVAVLGDLGVDVGHLRLDLVHVGLEGGHIFPRCPVGDRLRDRFVVRAAELAAAPDFPGHEVVLGGRLHVLVLVAEVEGVALVDEDDVGVLEVVGLLGTLGRIQDVGVSLARREVRQLVLGVDRARGFVAAFTNVDRAGDDASRLCGSELDAGTHTEAGRERHVRIERRVDHVPATCALADHGAVALPGLVRVILGEGGRRHASRDLIGRDGRGNEGRCRCGGSSSASDCRWGEVPDQEGHRGDEGESEDEGREYEAPQNLGSGFHSVVPPNMLRGAVLLRILLLLGRLLRLPMLLSSELRLVEPSLRSAGRSIGVLGRLGRLRASRIPTRGIAARRGTLGHVRASSALFDSLPTIGEE